MRKNFGQQTWFYPMPVLIVAAYDEKGNANAMNAAWGSVYDYKKVMICLDESHKTTQNIKVKKAFTISFADAKHVKECDYLGIVSGNEVPKKIEKAERYTGHPLDRPCYKKLCDSCVSIVLLPCTRKQETAAGRTFS